MLFGHLVRRDFNYNFSFGQVIHIFLKFFKNTKQILASYEPVENFCSKWIVNLFFLYYWRTPTYSKATKTVEGLKCKLSKKKFALLIESWIFNFFFTMYFAHGSTWWILDFHFFFHYVFLLMVPHDVIFYEIALIWMWSLCSFFPRNFTSSTLMEFESRPLSTKNSNPFIFTNLKVGSEPCVFNLIQKWCVKDPGKKENHLISIDFWNKKVQCLKKLCKKKLWCLNIIMSWILWNGGL
jgi:hypothetical protein